jgi:hypothetical protein
VLSECGQAEPLRWLVIFTFQRDIWYHVDTTWAYGNDFLAKVFRKVLDGAQEELSEKSSH